MLIQALCHFAERSRIFFFSFYGFQSQACVHPASVPYNKCAVSVTASILLLIHRSVLSSADVIYRLFSGPFKEPFPDQIRQIEFEQDALTKNDMAHHLPQTAVRISSDVMHLKKCYSKVQRRQQTTCLSLYLSNHQCCVNTMASAN